MRNTSTLPMQASAESPLCTHCRVSSDNQDSRSICRPGLEGSDKPAPSRSRSRLSLRLLLGQGFGHTLRISGEPKCLGDSGRSNTSGLLGAGVHGSVPRDTSCRTSILRVLPGCQPVHSGMPDCAAPVAYERASRGSDLARHRSTSEFQFQRSGVSGLRPIIVHTQWPTGMRNQATSSCCSGRGESPLYLLEEPSNKQLLFRKG